MLRRFEEIFESFHSRDTGKVKVLKMMVQCKVEVMLKLEVELLRFEIVVKLVLEISEAQLELQLG
jgi:hypothetical protein